MLSRVHVVGRGRVGRALAARLDERQLLDDRTPDLVLLCVPDRAIAEVAAAIAEGPWVAHVSGAMPLATLSPHRQRFGVHPLQTFTTARGPEQIDGAWAAVTAETAEGARVGRWLAGALGLRAFDLNDEARALYHAGAVFASNYLVTLYRAAARVMAAAGAPPEALVPLMQRTIDNGFDLTGPIARGDWSTVQRHLAALDEHHPDLAGLYRALAEATRP
jgi:predicted short-subunit dehydrogenase-like oxidoreductase (DUF2520 family)